MKARTDLLPQAGFIPLFLAAAAILAILALSTTGARAQDELDKGLDIGETIPVEMSAPDQNGDTRSLKSVFGRSGLILLFTRSLDW